jgi:hypothetical protein
MDVVKDLRININEITLTTDHLGEFRALTRRIEIQFITGIKTEVPLESKYF